MAAPPAAMGTLCSRASAALALAVAAAHALFAPLLHVQRVVAALGAEIAGDGVERGGRGIEAGLAVAAAVEGMCVVPTAVQRGPCGRVIGWAPLPCPHVPAL